MNTKMNTKLNTPTPRTDAKLVLCNYGEYRVPVDFARLLERELATITAERDQLRALLVLDATMKEGAK